MSKHPTERVRTVTELQATTMQQSDNALRRVAILEERVARAEGRLAEKDAMLAEFQTAYGRQADTITALSVVVQELEAKVGRGVDQVITGLEGRISGVEEQVYKLEHSEVSREADKRTLRLAAAFFDLPVGEMIPTLSQLQRKKGRPARSKNKPKDTPAAEQQSAKVGENAALQQPESENQ